MIKSKDLQLTVNNDGQAILYLETIIDVNENTTTIIPVITGVSANIGWYGLSVALQFNTRLVVSTPVKESGTINVRVFYW